MELPPLGHHGGVPAWERYPSASSEGPCGAILSHLHHPVRGHPVAIPSPPSHFEAVQMDPSNGSIQNSSRYRSCRGKFEVITELEGLLTHCCCGDGLRPHRSTKCVSLARDEKRIDVKNTRLETFITLQLGHHVVNSQRTRRAPHNTRPSPEKAEKHSTGTDFS